MKVTVFTPTYNRAHLIDRLYMSLANQTCKDFEWVVVDDGSTDDTEAYFSDLRNKENGFSIIYEKQKNGGKHRAINKGVKIARGELFFIVDSDDYLAETAVEKLIKWSDSLDSSRRWAGISGAKGSEKGGCVGGNGGKGEYIDARNIERDKYNLDGDKAEAYFTEVLRHYPFPEFDGENFVSEEVVWNAIAIDGYYIRWFKDIIYFCEYLDGGLTKSGNAKYKNNPQGTLYWAQCQMAVYPNNPKRRLRAIDRYYEAMKDSKKTKEIAKELGVSTFVCRLSYFVAKLKRFLIRG